MIEYARKLRGPATVGILVIICFYVAVAVVYFVALLNDGVYIATAARQAGADSVSLVWIFVAVALALTCLLVGPPVASAERVIHAAAVVVSVATGAGLIFWIIGLFGDFSLGAWLAALGGLVETLVKAMCAVVLWRLRRWSIDSPAAIGADQPDTGPADPAQASGRAPVWNPPEAVGLQWNRAGDAATGAAPPALAAGAPEAIEAPQRPQPRQTWSRGGIAPENLPAGSAQPAVQQPEDRPDDLPQPPIAPGRRPAPDWTPAPRPD